MPKYTADHDYYADLKLDSYATTQQIRLAFRQLAMKHHPDKMGPGCDGDATDFRRVREAYEVLSDLETRTTYDRARGFQNEQQVYRQYTTSATNVNHADNSAKPKRKSPTGAFRNNATPSKQTYPREPPPVVYAKRPAELTEKLTNAGNSKPTASKSRPRST